MIERIAIYFLLFFSINSIYSQEKAEIKKKDEFANRVCSSRKLEKTIDFSNAIKLNSFKTAIKIDPMKGIRSRPRIAFEVFFNNKISLELGLGAFWHGRRIYNNVSIHQSTDLYWYMGYGPAQGYDGYIEGKYAMNKGIRFINRLGLGFYYRYSHFDKTYVLYEYRGDDRNVDCTQSETSKIYCIKLTYDANIKGKNWKHFYLNPYISIMPGISYSNVIIENITYNYSNQPTYYSNSYERIDKPIYTAFKEIGLKICWGIGKKKEPSLENKI